VKPQFVHSIVYRPVGFSLRERHFGQYSLVASCLTDSSVAKNNVGDLKAFAAMYRIITMATATNISIAYVIRSLILLAS